LAGGFGSAVAEFLNDRGIAIPVERIGVPNVLVQHHKQETQRAQFGLSPENIAARVRALAPSRTSRPQ
jgi:1-deoxy-D-xylulose-5-phosphate synthase